MVGAIVDNLCLFAIAGGVAAMLGVGTMQIASGLDVLHGIASNKLVWIAIVSAIINLLSAGGKISGIDATKQIATVAGFPILFFMLLMAYCVVKVVVQQPRYDLASCFASASQTMPRRLWSTDQRDG